VRVAGRHLEPKTGRFACIDGDRCHRRQLGARDASGAARRCGVWRERRLQTARSAGTGGGRGTRGPTGVLLQFGKFRFLDVGDLTGAPLFQPGVSADRIGPVDVYLVAHSRRRRRGGSCHLAALRPRVAIVNNGAVKGGAAETLKTLQALPGTQTWQLHRSDIRGADNFAEEHIANLSEATSNWIVVRAR